MITQETVHELFDYHEDGYLIWKVSGKGRTKSVAGCINSDGYSVVGINGKVYYTHRIIFLWHHGYLPEGIVDHRDRNKLNCRIGNLRDVSRACNSKNCKVYKNNISGVTGVSFIESKKRYKAGIQINNKCVTIAYCRTLVDAVIARYKKEVELNWNGCNSTSSAYLYLQCIGYFRENKIK